MSCPDLAKILNLRFPFPLGVPIGLRPSCGLNPENPYLEKLPTRVAGGPPLTHAVSSRSSALSFERTGTR